MRSTPLVCVTVTAPTTAELCRRRDAVHDADLVELRLDSVEDPSAAGALAGRRGPVVVTCRPAWEGGGFTGPEETRRALLAEALALGADYVDLEWRARFDDLIAVAPGRRIVLSMHDFDRVPADLEARARAMRATGAAVVKLAVRTTRLGDSLTLLELGARMGREGGLVLIGMGETGLATRVLAGRFGSCWTYAGDQASVGQVSLRTLLDEYRLRHLTEATTVYGIVGRPVAHSVSPAMHNAAFGAAGLDAVYLPLPAADVEDFLAFADGIDLQGASVTTPYKVALFERVAEADSTAQRIYAINTLRRIDGRWIGLNTDVNGFLAPLAGRLALRGARASILGAGGAARAAAAGLASAGAEVTVHARDPERAERVALLVGGRAGPWPPARGSWDVLVNATPVGMHPRTGETPVGASALSGRLVYDLIYNPPVTRLLREAAAAGCETVGGLDMLVAQAVEQFRWWTDVRPSPALMRRAAEARLAAFAAAAGGARAPQA